MKTWTHYIIAIFLSAFLTQSFASGVSCLHKPQNQHSQHEMHLNMSMEHSDTVHNDCSSDNCLCTAFCNTTTLTLDDWAIQSISIATLKFAQVYTSKPTNQPKSIYHPPIA